MATQVETLKQEISEYYLKDFKKELGWFKSIALLPIEKKVKDIIIGKTELPKHFDETKEFGWWRYIIDFVSPSTAKEIFEFMKEKRLEIEKRNTQEELAKLRSEILGETLSSDSTENTDQNSDVSGTTQVSSSVNSSSSSESTPHETPNEAGNEASHNALGYGIGTSVGGVAGLEAVDRMIRQAEARNLGKIDAEKMKSGMRDLIQNLEQQKKALGSRLSSRQLRNIDTTIKKMSSGFESLDDEGIIAFKQWNALKSRIPDKLLNVAGISSKQLSKLAPYAEDLIGKSPDEIREFMKLRKVDVEMSDEVLKLLSLSKDVQEFQAMSNVLSKGKKLTQWMKALKSAMMIDVAFLGLDVWMYLETMDESELIAKVNQARAENKKYQAQTQLVIGVASFAIEAIILCGGVGGAIGNAPGAVVGLAVGAVTAAASLGADALYFDTHDFYLQNREDFLRQSRAELRQAVLQGVHNQRFGDQSWNEKIGAPTENIKKKNLDEAIYSLLFIEEMRESGDEMLYSYLASRQSESDFLNTLTPEQAQNFSACLAKIKEKIAIRAKYLAQQFQKPDLMQKLKSGVGISALVDIVAESAGYLKMSEAKKWDEKLEYSKNLAAYKSEFFADFSPEQLQNLEKLRQSNGFLFDELMCVSDYDSLIAEEASGSYQRNLELVRRYKEWIEIEQRSEGKSTFAPQDTNKNMAMLESLIEHDFDEARIQMKTLNREGLIDMVQEGQERNSVLEFSDDLGQNVRYQLAKRLYGYEGENSTEELMRFFSEDKGGVHGMYYSNQWKVNRDRKIDKALSEQLPKKFKAADVARLVQQIVKILGSNIDTKTEAIDGYLQKEFEQVFSEILRQELMARTLEAQEKIKNQISTFVQKYAKNEEYVELPYYLVTQTKRAGLGDLQRKFFSWKEGKMQICSLASDLGGLEVFTDAEKQYLESDRTQYSPEQQTCINRVEKAHKKLEDLRNVQGIGSFEDDLDLPKEIEILISQKYKDREQFKYTLQLYRPGVAASLTLAQSEAYAQYFENLYKGLLLRLSQFKMTNDIDDFWSFQEAIRLGEQKNFDKEGNLVIEKGSPLDHQLIKDFYVKQLENLKLKTKGGEKALKSLWKSGNSDEKELALRASNLVIESILECWMLQHVGTEKMKITEMTLNEGLLKSIDQRIQDQISSLEVVLFINDTKIPVGTYQIKTLSWVEESLVGGVTDLQKQIEGMKDTVVWQGKRGNIEYLPKTSEIKSWNHKTKIERKADKFILSGLDLEFSLEEVLWFANFTNRCVSKYHGKKVEFKTDWINSAFNLRKTLVIDGTMLLQRGDLEAKCGLLKEDLVLQKLADWLSKHLS